MTFCKNVIAEDAIELSKSVKYNSATNVLMSLVHPLGTTSFLNNISARTIATIATAAVLLLAAASVIVAAFADPGDCASGSKGKCTSRSAMPEVPAGESPQPNPMRAQS
jgi:hypothetical protein